MNSFIDTNPENKTNTLRKKSLNRQDGSYRIFHITKKIHDESDDECNLCKRNEQTIDKENHRKSRHQKRSFKMSSQNESERWKRKSTKNKLASTVSKKSSESTFTDIGDSSLSPSLKNKSSPLIILHGSTAPNNEQKQSICESLQSDVLIDVVDQTTIHDDVTLNDLLARADRLETTVKLQDFNKLQPQSQTNMYRRRKRCIIALSSIFVVLTITIIIIIFVLIMTIRYKAKTNQASKSIQVQHPNR